MSAADDALDVARFCVERRMDIEYVAQRLMREDRDHIAAAERVLVERGLGGNYCGEMMSLYSSEVLHSRWRYDYDVWALVAPLDARLRALARVVREQQPKEAK